MRLTLLVLIFSCVCALACASAEEELKASPTPEESVFLSWVTEKGADYKGIVWPVQNADGERAAYTSRITYPRQNFVRVPSSLIITREVAMNSSLVMPELMPVDEADTLIFWLLSERALGNASYWWPYLQTLPKARDTLSSWSLQEQVHLQDSFATARVQAYQAVLVDRYNTYKPAAEKIIAYDPHGYDFEVFDWAFFIIRSRTFRIRNAGCPLYPAVIPAAVVPLADVFNHNSTSFAKWSIEKDCFFRVTPPVSSLPVPKGVEATITYAELSNRDALLTYGFSLGANNPHDSIYIGKLGKFWREVTAARIAFAGDGAKSNTHPYRMLRYFRANANDNETEPKIWPGDASEDRAALVNIIARLQEIIDEKPTTRAFDEEELTRSHDNSVPARRYVVALKYRLNQLRIKEFLLGYYNMLLGELDKILQSKESPEILPTWRETVDNVTHTYLPWGGNPRVSGVEMKLVLNDEGTCQPFVPKIEVPERHYL